MLPRITHPLPPLKGAQRNGGQKRRRAERRRSAPVNTVISSESKGGREPEPGAHRRQAVPENRAARARCQRAPFIRDARGPARTSAAAAGTNPFPLNSVLILRSRLFLTLPPSKQGRLSKRATHKMKSWPGCTGGGGTNLLKRRERRSGDVRESKRKGSWRGTQSKRSNACSSPPCRCWPAEPVQLGSPRPRDVVPACSGSEL